MDIKEYESLETRRREINIGHLENGVEFVDINAAYIDESVVIGKGTVIYPCVVLQGDTMIGENCIIGQNSRIVDSKIGNEVEVQSSHILESKVGSQTKVGPFAYIRPNSNIGESCKVGDFVEVKNSTMGDKSKASHLTYIGDADIGSGVNLGCGVVFVNYDGKNKYRTTVEDGAFIGCNTNLVSPVNVGKKAYIGAGSTVRHDVEAGNLYVTKGKEQVIENWVERRGL
ncbi:MAG: hypothetical protein ACTTH0_02490 [Eubacteriales bacterium]